MNIKIKVMIHIKQCFSKLFAPIIIIIIIILLPFNDVLIIREEQGHVAFQTPLKTKMKMLREKSHPLTTERIISPNSLKKNDQQNDLLCDSNH